MMTLTVLSSCLHLPNPEITGTCHHALRLHPHAFLNLVRAPFHALGIPTDPTRMHHSKRQGDWRQFTVTRARVCCFG